MRGSTPEVIHTPATIERGIAYAKGHVFTGDTLTEGMGCTGTRPAARIKRSWNDHEENFLA